MGTCDVCGLRAIGMVGVATCACICADYSKSLSKHALAMLNRYYARAYRNGPMDYHAREKVRKPLDMRTSVGLPQCVC